MYTIIHTQKLENYGVFEEPVRQYWKAKGGQAFILEFDQDESRFSSRLYYELISSITVSSEGLCVYPIGDPITVRDRREVVDALLEIDDFYYGTATTQSDNPNIRLVIREHQPVMPPEISNDHHFDWMQLYYDAPQAEKREHITAFMQRHFPKQGA